MACHRILMTIHQHEEITQTTPQLITSKLDSRLERENLIQQVRGSSSFWQCKPLAQ